jgi:hypothetical protein
MGCFDLGNGKLALVRVHELMPDKDPGGRYSVADTRLTQQGNARYHCWRCRHAGSGAGIRSRAHRIIVLAENPWGQLADRNSGRTLLRNESENHHGCGFSPCHAGN